MSIGMLLVNCISLSFQTTFANFIMGRIDSQFKLMRASLSIVCFKDCYGLEVALIIFVVTECCLIREQTRLEGIPVRVFPETEERAGKNLIFKT